MGFDQGLPAVSAEAMIRIAASARWDLEEGYEFYESQEIGLGDYFLNSVKADIESLKITGGVHKVAYADYHRLLCKTFPFAVYYTKSESDITIFAVIDCRRDPAWIRGYLRKAGEQPAKEPTNYALRSRTTGDQLADHVG